MSLLTSSSHQSQTLHWTSVLCVIMFFECIRIVVRWFKAVLRLRSHLVWEHSQAERNRWVIHPLFCLSGRKTKRQARSASDRFFCLGESVMSFCYAETCTDMETLKMAPKVSAAMLIETMKKTHWCTIKLGASTKTHSKKARFGWRLPRSGVLAEGETAKHCHVKLLAFAKSVNFITVASGVSASSAARCASPEIKSLNGIKLFHLFIKNQHGHRCTQSLHRTTYFHDQWINEWNNCLKLEMVYGDKCHHAGKCPHSS